MREAREQIHVLRTLKGSKTFKMPEHCLETSKTNPGSHCHTHSLSGAKTPCFLQLKLGICILINKGWVRRYEILVCCWSSGNTTAMLGASPNREIKGHAQNKDDTYLEAVIGTSLAFIISNGGKLNQVCQPQALEAAVKEVFCLRAKEELKRKKTTQST